MRDFTSTSLLRIVLCFCPTPVSTTPSSSNGPTILSPLLFFFGPFFFFLRYKFSSSSSSPFPFLRCSISSISSSSSAESPSSSFSSSSSDRPSSSPSLRSPFPFSLLLHVGCYYLMHGLLKSRLKAFQFDSLFFFYGNGVLKFFFRI